MFHGKGAHAGGAVSFVSVIRPSVERYFADVFVQPWDGINALDAAVQVYNNISMLRQHILPTDRIHGVIKLKEDQPVNVIPDYARVIFICRSLTSARLQELKGRLDDIFEAAAKATGCTYELKRPYEYKGESPRGSNYSLNLARC